MFGKIREKCKSGRITAQNCVCFACNSMVVAGVSLEQLSGDELLWISACRPRGMLNCYKLLKFVWKYMIIFLGDSQENKIGRLLLKRPVYLCKFKLIC